MYAAYAPVTAQMWHSASLRDQPQNTWAGSFENYVNGASSNCNALVSPLPSFDCSSSARPWTAPDTQILIASPRLRNIYGVTGLISGKHSITSKPSSARADGPRSKTADICTLRPVVERHNRNVQVALGSILKHPEYAPPRHGDASLKTQQRLDALRDDIEEVSANVDRMLGKGFAIAEYDYGHQNEHAHDAEFFEQQQYDVPQTTTQTSRTPRMHVACSRSQLIEKFKDIDKGNASRDHVFTSVPPGLRRLEVKLDYFRERSELLVPRIEDQFMRVDGQTGESRVNLKKLHALRESKLKEGEVSPESLPVMSGSGEALAAVASKQTLSTMSMSSSKIESFEQRAARLLQQGQSRDRHIAQVRKTERSKHVARRLGMLSTLQNKMCRKEMMAKQRSVFMWMIVALSCDAFVRLWQNSLALRQPSRGRCGKWRSVVNSWRSHAPKSLMPAMQRRLVAVTQMVVAAKERKERGRVAYLRMRTILVCVRFLGMLKYRRARNTHADRIKNFMECSWKGYQIRASMKLYLKRMKTLQRSMRACVKLRNHIRQFILLPAFWEAETVVLAEIMGMPKAILDGELAWHRSFSDIAERTAEILRLSESRAAWKDWTTGNGSFKERMITPNALNEAQTTCQRVATKKRTARRHALGTGNVSALGKAGLVAEDVRIHREPHPLMIPINKYRLPEVVRLSIINTILQESTNRWWKRYQEYKEQCKIFQDQFRQWHLEVSALGPHHRQIWPMCPSIPFLSLELFKFDEKWLQSQIHFALRQTVTKSEVPQCLFST